MCPGFSFPSDQRYCIRSESFQILRVGMSQVRMGFLPENFSTGASDPREVVVNSQSYPSQFSE